MSITVAPAPPGKEQVRVAQTLDQAWRASTGNGALNEAVWIDLDHPQPDSAAFVATIDVAKDPVGYAHVARADNAAGGANDKWTLGYVVDPGSSVVPIGMALVEAATTHVETHGGGTVVAWRTGEHEADVALGTMGYEVARELLQMRVPLPVAEEPRWPDGFSVRTFEPGVDDRAWLEVNNGAFAGHAEQGNWTEVTLQRRLTEPWFDASLFFLAIDAHGIAGFNWCKVHEPEGNDPAFGEIFAIGVDDRARGTRLGRALALAGLRAMAQRGIRNGMLYVAEDNGAALALYRSIGFRTYRTDRAFVRTMKPAS
jgi:mycothiol synthase